MAANRGKFAEGEVKKWCTRRSDADASFAFHRHPDPHAGSLQPVPADFEAMFSGTHCLLEVKEVKHAFRLPEKNFSADKVARMVKWQMAGSYGWVLVCHMPDKVWRLVPISVFQPPRPASWDLKAYPVQTLDEIMCFLFGAK